jgi:hypothetical protein
MQTPVLPHIRRWRSVSVSLRWRRAPRLRKPARLSWDIVNGASCILGVVNVPWDANGIHRLARAIGGARGISEIAEIVSGAHDASARTHHGAGERHHPHDTLPPREFLPGDRVTARPGFDDPLDRTHPRQ